LNPTIKLTFPFHSLQTLRNRNRKKEHCDKNKGFVESLLQISKDIDNAESSLGGTAGNAIEMYVATILTTTEPWMWKSQFDSIGMFAMFLKYLTREDLQICWDKFDEMNPDNDGTAGSLQRQFEENVGVIKDMINKAKVAYATSSMQGIKDETVFITRWDMEGLKRPDKRTGKCSSQNYLFSYLSLVFA
jgi:hypothetical protein